MARNSRPLAGRLVTRGPGARAQERAEHAEQRAAALTPKRWSPPAERDSA